MSQRSDYRITPCVIEVYLRNLPRRHAFRAFCGDSPHYLSFGSVPASTHQHLPVPTSPEKIRRTLRGRQ